MKVLSLCIFAVCVVAAYGTHHGTGLDGLGVGRGYGIDKADGFLVDDVTGFIGSKGQFGYGLTTDEFFKVFDVAGSKVDRRETELSRFLDDFGIHGHLKAKLFTTCMDALTGYFRSFKEMSKKLNSDLMTIGIPDRFRIRLLKFTMKMAITGPGQTNVPYDTDYKQRQLTSQKGTAKTKEAVFRGRQDRLSTKERKLNSHKLLV